MTNETNEKDKKEKKNFRDRILEKLHIDLSLKEGKYQLALLIIGIVLLLVTVTSGAIAVTIRSNFCSTCHIMKSEYTTWSVTSHNQIKCVNCHVKPGLTNLLIEKVGAIKEVFSHVTRSYEVPIRSTKTITDEVCKQCHSIERRVSSPGDIIIPHLTHSQKGVQCVECHRGVAHGNIGQREVTKTIPFEKWNAKIAREQTVPEYTDPQMNLCLNCHTKRKVSTACSTCHLDKTAPSYHNTVTWLDDHGLNTTANVKDCIKCHGYQKDGKKSIANFKFDTQWISKNKTPNPNLNCAKCHEKAHPQNFKLKHSIIVNLDGPNSCLSCHTTTKGCISCHSRS